MNHIKYPSKAVITVGKPDAHKEIHIGHLSGGLVTSDIFARFLRNRIGFKNVFFATGTECYGTAVYEEYLKKRIGNETIEEYIHSNHKKQNDTLEKFQISLNGFYCDSSEIELHTIHSKLCQRFVDSLVRNNNVVMQREKILIDPETATFLNYRQIQYKGKANPEGRKYNVEDIESIVSSLSYKKPMIKDVDNYFFELSKRESSIMELIKERYSEIGKYLKGVFPLANNNVNLARLTCNSNIGMNIEIENESKKLWNWIDSLIAPISYTMYYEFKHKKRLEDWTEWWCSDSSEIYHFMAQDNAFFYMIIEPYLIQSWNDINIDKINYPNYILTPMRTIFNGRYEGPFPTGELLLKKYDVEAIRYSIASMGNRISSFNPEKLLDESLEKDSIDFKYNAILKKIKRLFSMTEKQMTDTPQTILASQECVNQGKFLYSRYEEKMMTQEFSKAIDLIEENFKRFLNDKDGIVYNTKLAFIMLYPFLPETIKEKYMSVYSDFDLYEGYDPENPRIDLNSITKKKKDENEYSK